MTNPALAAGAYLKGLFQQNRQDEFFPCTIMGMPYSGKTSLLHRLHQGEYQRPFMSSSFRLTTETVPVPSEGVSLTFRDLGGGCVRVPRRFYSHFQSPETVFLYVVDTSDIYATKMDWGEMLSDLTGIEAKYVAVVFSKRDEKGPHDPEILKVISGYKESWHQVQRQVDFPCELYDDLDELSALTGRHTDILLTRLARASKAKAKNKEVPRPRSPAKVPSSTPTLGPPMPPMPSREELVQKAKSGLQSQNNLLSASEFMKRIVSGELDEWDHHSHLRAGFLALTDCILHESVVFDSTDLFLKRLDQMLKAAPHKFKNTIHRTMTTFWLHQIYLAMLSFREEHGSFPAHDAFDKLLLEYPDLMYGHAWSEYYTKDLLFSSDARGHWRLPNRKPLPKFVSRTQGVQGIEEADSGTPASTAGIYKKYAFVILKAVKLKNRRRAAVIDLALPIIQSHIMRLRTRPGSAVDLYSETQAYFWIQMVHAAVDSLPPDSLIDITKVDFQSFNEMFGDILGRDDAWKEYYTPVQWNNAEARKQIILPVRKSLPNVWSAPESALVERAVSSSLDKKYSPKANNTTRFVQPSLEELLVESRWAMKEVSELKLSDTGAPSTHVGLIYRIFNRLVDADDPNDAKIAHSLSRAARDAVSFLHNENKVTLAGFWSDMVLGTFSWMDKRFHEKVGRVLVEKDEANAQIRRQHLFSGFLAASPELCWDGLWRMYYSDEVWMSEDAGQEYVFPDERRLPVYSKEKNSEKKELGLEDWEWIDENAHWDEVKAS